MRCARWRNLGRLVVLVVLLGVSSAGRTAVNKFRIEGPGLYLAGVGFFGAVPAEAGKDSIEVRFGDLETLDWVPGALPVVDAHVMLMNSSGRHVANLGVRVSLYLGSTVLSVIAAGEDLSPGAKNVRETLFFERVYTVRSLKHAQLGRVSINDIHLGDAIEDQMRQHRWPAYLRVEAQVVEKPPWLETPVDSTTRFLKVLPRHVVPAAVPLAKP